MKYKKIIIIAVAAVVLAAACIAVFGRRAGRILNIGKCEISVPIKSGDTLSSVLTAQNLTMAEIHSIDGLLRETAGVRNLRADSDKLVLTKKTEEAPVEKILLINGPWRQVELNCADGVWSAKTIDVEKEVRIVHKFGEIKDGDSFYLAAQRADIPAGVILEVYDLLAFEMDFERDIRAGQQFSVLYEENYASGDFVNTGSIIRVSFDALRGNVNMYRFKKSDNTVGYYDERGNGAIKSLKRTPINNARVSSSFSMNRKHPVLGYTRAHKGVDFRAASGTPIPSAGAGRIAARGYNSGHGNFIRVRHNGSYETLYAHMSKFQKGVVVGTAVRQGQIIGYVGSTGLSTGPHLHYEVIQNGRHVNPMTVKLPAINNLPDADRPAFMELKTKIDNAAEMLRNNPKLTLQL
ncbi:MAG: peptidoglycan DD-metalloendopeptidase family protein [Rickettsiales bacterium]|jgi:murein DD-endopeptidase MepM/ murein hydrolase activator NlpD|nr:peptidoglycan DD-metalloendopeptidase family protein [Rickettsiales bacterium]